ncbi:D-alanyl-D-alanine carboxypeptidase, partial [Streptomyces sp. NPDC051913]
MAGESPDRSKQRESSAEPTSGSAGPVPEARTEVRDPRLAVARDTAESADAGTEPRGGVDTATRVFSVRDVAKARESAARAETGEGGAAEAAEAAGDAGTPEGSEAQDPATETPATQASEAEGTGPDTGGDARLRAAVAAWVRSGDGTPSGAEDAPATADGDAEATGAGERAADGPDGAAKADEAEDAAEPRDAGPGAEPADKPTPTGTDPSDAPRAA